MSSQISAVVTYNARCARSLLNILPHSLQGGRVKPSSPNSVLLFALAPSPTTPPEVLSDITSTLTHLYPEHVGCISALLPYQYLDPSVRSEPYSCSLAFALVDGVSFRSTISGPAQAQVGRWHAARQRSVKYANGVIQVDVDDPRMRFINDLSQADAKVNWEDVWDGTYSTSPRHGNDPETLPDTLRDLDQSAIHNILYFSDQAQERFASTLEGAFPRANKLSLVASSTPFITGRPVTLFHNGSILSNGAVGIALNSSPSSPPPVVEVSFPPLVPLSTNLNVTSSNGNLVLSLDSGNPTQLLLKAIQELGLSPSHTTWVGKKDEFYVGVIDPPSQQLSQLHRISAGDPSRGAIALDAASAPRGGSVVRLYYRPRDPSPDSPTYFSNTLSTSISLFVAPEMTPATSSRSETTDNLVADHAVVSNAFLAASENGFTLSRGAQGSWKCVVPGGRVELSYSTPR